ncbi:MAG TPA: hypothetical protein VGV88_14925 [Candidatus Dormibacteraeota bacterium]|nr:hypothetical protein [Candidatus Dormibacteraeota bacterium]
MKRGYIEVAVFLVVAAGAFSLAYWLAQTVGLHPLVVPPQDLREKHWMVAAGAAAFVVVVDALVFFLIVLKHRRERRARESGGTPVLRG